jgi:hypothetical protein
MTAQPFNGYSFYYHDAGCHPLIDLRAELFVRLAEQPFEIPNSLNHRIVGVESMLLRFKTEN